MKKKKEKVKEVMIRVEECLNSVGGVLEAKDTSEFRRVGLRWRLILLEDIYSLFFIRRSYVKPEFEGFCNFG